MSEAGGIILVDKPRGWTSHDVVAFVRRKLGRGAKVGHSGTLDPMATGLLILLIGKATKLAAYYQKLPKVYSGHLRLGLETDSGDLEGKIMHEAPVPEISDNMLQDIFDAHLGEVETPIPLYSAVKHKGRPLYDYARKGEVVEPKTRVSRVFEWRLLGWSSPEAAFRLRCSSGTYVRSLAELIGKKIGCGATLSSLRRESVGNFKVSDSVSMESVRSMQADGLDKLIRSGPPAPQDAPPARA